MSRCITLITLVLVTFLAGQRTYGAESPPNIVLFFVDDLGWSDVGCYGSSFYDTPNIDALADEGVRFTDAYATCHVCSPSRASLLTGKYPARLDLTDWLPGRQDFSFQKLQSAEHRQWLPAEEITLAEALKAHGYSTAIFGKWHLGEEPNGPESQGFDIRIPNDWNKGWPRKGYHAPFQLGGIEGEDGDYLTDRLTDEALGYIESNKDKPFFLYLSHFAVHDPIQGRSDLVEKYTQRKAQLPPIHKADYILEENPDVEERLSPEQKAIMSGEEAFRGYRDYANRMVKIKQFQDNAQFAAMVESMDESLGRVRSKLDELDIAENTIVIFFSDNGGMSGANFGNPKRIVSSRQLDRAYSTSNLPLRGAKGWLYEGGIRVPLIVKWPGQGTPGSTCEVPVIGTDIYPTLLEMAALPSLPPQHMDGKSIAPLVKGDTALDRDAIYWHFPHYSNHGYQSPGGAIRSGDYKLLDYFENDTVQLFNLRDDPGEQNDLSKGMPELVAALREKLQAWRRDVGANMMPPNPDYRKQAKITTIQSVVD
jgi:arylsulfatase A-like enzyme